MDWDDRLLDVAALGAGQPHPGQGELASLAQALLEEQSRVWPQLRDGLLSLKSVEIRTLDITGVAISLQHNPQRLVSTSARVDDTSISQRPCFLCSENMPREEQGIAFGANFAIFCNPFPVLPAHLVVISREHIPQRIAGHIESFLGLASSLGSEYVVLYNGAKCGASAPDHLHFQAGRGDRLVIFDEARRLREVTKPIVLDNEIGVHQSHAYGVGFVTLVSREITGVTTAIERILETLRPRSGADEEAMVNLLARYEEGQWEVILLPRRQHRPRVYFEEGDAKILVSPAAIDLGGLLVVPRRQDFVRLDPSTVGTIFEEVTFKLQELESLLATLSETQPVEGRA